MVELLAELTDREQDRTSIENHICFRILGPKDTISKRGTQESVLQYVQCSHARVLDQAAPDPTQAFDDDGRDHDDDSRETKLEDLMLRAHEARYTLQTDLHKGSDHNNGEDQYTDRFKTVEVLAGAASASKDCMYVLTVFFPRDSGTDLSDQPK